MTIMTKARNGVPFFDIVFRNKERGEIFWEEHSYPNHRFDLLCFKGFLKTIGKKMVNRLEIYASIPINLIEQESELVICLCNLPLGIKFLNHN